MASPSPSTATERAKNAGEPEPARAATSPHTTADGNRIAMLDMASIYPNENQPRKQFDDEALAALATSIRTAGLMQPIVVRLRDDDLADTFEIIAGERRWRAAMRIGLEAIPAIIHEADDQQVAEWTLIENVQREDLNAVEKALAFKRLADEFELTHQQIAQAVGLNRSSVSNHLRMLDLDSTCLDLVRNGLLDLGHAKALLSVPDPAKRQKLAATAVREGWSVRALEKQVKSGSASSDNQAAGKAAGGGGASLASTKLSPHLRDLQQQLSDHLGTRVHIQPGAKPGQGRLVLEFYDNAQFEGILDKLQFTLDR